MTSYLSESCARLGLRAGPDRSALAAVARREEELGFPLPAALAEWYALPQLVEHLAAHNPGDFVPVEDLEEADGRLVIAQESVGVCTWAVPLDEGHDPPVLVEVDLTPGFWQLHAASFSAFAATLAWDAELETGRMLMAHNPPMRPTDLALLRGRFTEAGTTHVWPARTTYRFERGRDRVALWDREDASDWCLCSDTTAGLTALARELWDCGDLAGQLYAPVGEDEDAHEVLSQLRGC